MKCTPSALRSFLKPWPLPWPLLFILLLTLGACKKNNSGTSGTGGTTGTTANPDLQLVTDGLVSPTALAEPPDSSHRLFIVDQVGKIWIIGANGQKLANPFIDLGARMVSLSPGYDERGLLGLAFHPQFKTNGKFYVFYTAPPRAGTPVPGGAGATWDNLTRVSEFKVSAADSNTADMSTERILLQSDHPYSNHNGGALVFGPDGYLYISIGDGGNADDVGNGHVSDWYAANAGGNGQDIYMNLMGNILRIDVNSGSPYAIPPTNPFVGTTARPEIYAYGFRNPFRFSFDMGGSHQLLAADVGQSLYEEVDVVTSGGNYGWNVKEGTHCFDTDNDKTERSSCPNTDSAGKPLIDPVIEMINAANPKGGGIAVAIIGGFIYRGGLLPGLQGKYIFGVLSQSGHPDGQVFSSTPAATGRWSWSALGLKSFTPNLGTYLKSFGQDQHGEVYLLTSDQVGPGGFSGKVYKMVVAK